MQSAVIVAIGFLAFLASAKFRIVGVAAMVCSLQSCAEHHVEVILPDLLSLDKYFEYLEASGHAELLTGSEFYSASGELLPVEDAFTLSRFPIRLKHAQNMEIRSVPKISWQFQAVIAGLAVGSVVVG